MANGVTILWHPQTFLTLLDVKIDKKLNQASNEYKESVKASFGQPGKPNVITGQLRDSIQVAKVNKGKYRIGSGLKYATYLEYGTSRMSKRPYFRPVLSMFMTRLKQIFRSSY